MVEVEKAVAAYEAIFGELNLDNFDKRLHFQKTVYLLKYLGINFSNLNFTWFRRGPYCFQIVGIQHRTINTADALDRVEKEKINQIKPIVESLMKDSRSAELYSSVAFLRAEEKLSSEQIIYRMKLVKPWFTQQEVEEGMKIVNELVV